jgi:Dna[CI] antecedent, DciA
MDRIDAEVRRELDRVGPGAGGLEALTRAWAACVGDTIARNAWPARLADSGTLHVATSSSTWAFELTRLAQTILDQLRPALEEATPRTLKFAPGPLPGPPPPAPASAARHAPRATPEQRAEAASLAAGIEDEELRTLVARAAAASLAKAAAEPPDDRRF